MNRWVLSLDMKRDIDGSVRIQRGILFQRVGARTAKDLLYMYLYKIALPQIFIKTSIPITSFHEIWIAKRQTVIQICASFTFYSIGMPRSI